MSSLLLFCSLVGIALANQVPERPMLKLWPNGNPGGWTRTDREVGEYNKDSQMMIVSAVSEPTLEFYRSKSAKPDAPTVMVCPGGGYSIEAIEHEGWEIAERLNLSGINAAVLKYRLPNRDKDKPLFKAPLQDAQRAIRLLRSHAAEFRITPDRVGILGFSAGGHLAAVTSNTSAATYPDVDEADKLSAKPDFTVLIYPAYLNKDKTMELVDDFKVSEGAPPAFIVQAVDDPIPIEGALAYTHACHEAKVPVELHLFPKGGHGYGLRSHEARLKIWPELLLAWIDWMYP